MRTLAVANLLTAATASVRARTEATPVSKVIELLQNLQQDTKEQGAKEAAQWKEYADFCHKQKSEKNYLINKSAKKIEKLTSKFELLAAEIAELSTSIAELNDSADSLDADMKAGAAQRAEEHNMYKEVDNDLSTAIDSVIKAIAAMKESKSSMKGAKLNLAKIKDVLSSTAEAMMMMKLGQKPAGYEFQSNDILATLDSLKDMLLNKKKAADEAEFGMKEMHDKKELNQRNQRKFKLKERDEKQMTMDKKLKEKGITEVNRAEEDEDKTMDEQYLAELTKTCAVKKSLWEQRSSTRADELVAIADALKVLKEEVKPSYKANKELAQVQEAARPSSFLQVRKNGDNVGIQKALQMLSSAARHMDSSPLSLLVVQAAQAKDHFVKVRGLISDLIDRLEADAQGEADQKSFCDKAMSANIDERDNARTNVEKTAAEKTRNEAEKKRLAKDIAELSASIASLTKSLAEQAQLRNEEKEENLQTVALAKKGQSGVEFAIQVLSEFYGSAAASYVQTGWVPPNAGRDNKTVADKDPDIFSTEYHGQQKKSEGILGILEVIQTDFTRTIEETESQEADAESEFQMIEEDMKSEIAQKEKLKGKKSDRSIKVTDDITSNENSLAELGGILKATEEEFASLKPLCVEGEETYAERVAKREKEIEALKQALTVLENWQS